MVSFLSSDEDKVKPEISIGNNALLEVQDGKEKATLRRSEATYIVATTHAAPPMSPLISSILPLGFKLIPPLSNVTPFPVT
ncbi:hypothetical protein C0J52_05594 [Blattella germanica]|nr:hypothetical protein C0J52_05594 [Blattella germanica]